MASAVEGMRFARTAPGGAVPLADGSHPAPETPDAGGAAEAAPERPRRADEAAEVGLVAVNAALAQEGFRRPPVRRRVRLR